VLCLSASQPGSFITAPQRDSMLAGAISASADVSADGRYVAFESYAALVPADTNDRRDIYVLDLETRRVTLESALPDSPVDITHPRLSGDGRFLVFETAIASPGSFRSAIVRCDRWTATSKVVTTGPGGVPANGSSRDPDISDDGQVVVFASSATNLVAGTDANGSQEDVYLFDVRSGTVGRVSVDASGNQSPAGASLSPRVSGDGLMVAFASSAPLTVAAAGSASAPARPTRQVYVRDLVNRTTTRVSGDGQSASADGDNWGPAISRDGRFVAFVSDATSPGSGPRHRPPDVFLRDRRTGTLTVVSRGMDGEGASGTSGVPAISGDGRFVAFQSDASNLVCGKRCPPGDEDINLVTDVFVFDRERATTLRVSEDESSGWMEASRGPALDSSGRVLAFSSRHPTDPLDRGDDYDLFVRVAGGIGFGL
jgi:Tol biopolymer transport system component